MDEKERLTRSAASVLPLLQHSLRKYLHSRRQHRKLTTHKMQLYSDSFT